jgi:hypothetical protein
MNEPSSTTRIKHFTPKDFEKYKSWLSLYSKNSRYTNIVLDYNSDQVAAIDISDLKKATITINPQKIFEIYPDTETEDVLFYLFHEIEHLNEESQMRATKE